MTVLGPPVLAAVPAHDEVDSIGSCVTALARALGQAQRSGLVGRAMVAVSAHRCTDDTASAARRTLAELVGGYAIEGLVVEDRRVGPVGAVRSRLIEQAVRTLQPIGSEHADAWVFSTDADSVVPPSWVEDVFAAAARHPGGAEAVAGLVDLTDWTEDPIAQAHYDAIIAAGLCPDGGHTHAYAANLAVRLTAYEAVGGFPALEHGEEHGLLAALRRHGYRIASSPRVRVTTSGRIEGRAAGGLATLLNRLVTPVSAPSPVVAVPKPPRRPRPSTTCSHARA